MNKKQLTVAGCSGILAAVLYGFNSLEMTVFGFDGGKQIFSAYWYVFPAGKSVNAPRFVNYLGQYKFHMIISIFIIGVVLMSILKDKKTKENKTTAETF